MNLPKRINPNYSTRENADYRVWQQMKQRCCNPKSPRFDRYGGRDANPIKVCDRWKDSFENFISDMGPRPEPKHSFSIERENNNGDYEPNNCSWIPKKDQSRNTSRTIVIEHEGEKKLMTDLATETGISKSTLSYRVEQGFKGEDLLRKPISRREYELNGRTYRLNELAKISGINKDVLGARLKRYGWGVERAISTPVNPKK